jgi:hypothetical protein
MSIFSRINWFQSALCTTAVCFALTAGAAEMPKISGMPVIDHPDILEWPNDSGLVTPNLNDPAANTLNDFHGNITSCDLVLSTEGNYHPALHDIWPKFLAKFKSAPLQNWFYTTSPPIVADQIKNKIVQFGNLYSSCKPSLAVASKAVIDKLVKAGLAEGQTIPLYQDRGDVILVKSGNPKRIKTVWDLGRPDVAVVTPNPDLEQSALDSYAQNIFNIAAHDLHPPKGMDAEKLINRIFNGTNANQKKWLAGPRIHHRDVPWSIAYGQADAGVILYHLGRYTAETFPDKFEIVPLGGSVADPKPLPGTKTGVGYLVRLKGDWTPGQKQARDNLIDTLLSDEFTQALTQRGLQRPPEFAAASVKTAEGAY